MEGKIFTYAEMNATAEKMAAGLLACGLTPGERVAVWGPNQADWLITKWAVAKEQFKKLNQQKISQQTFTQLNSYLLILK
jgi:long-subunit acyl-CoA synthetase (AMP-forming)